jgi:hypothetical protein
VPAAEPLLKGLKAGMNETLEKNLLQKGKSKVATINKAGKATTKSVDVVQLTEAGEKYLRDAVQPEALAATRAGEFVALRQNLEADRKQLRDELQAALKGQGKSAGEGRIQKELSVLSKKVNALAQQLEKLERVAQGGDDSAVLNKIDQAFASLLARLDKALQSQPAPTEMQRSASTPADSLATVLHRAYEKLRLFIEFRDGLVELPRLFHEARKSLPELTMKAFQDELMVLWDRHEAELHILNEEYKAAEPDKGIRHNDKLYYYVMWKRS